MPAVGETTAPQSAPPTAPLMDSLTVREAIKLAWVFEAAAAELDETSEHRPVLESVGNALSAAVEAHHAKL